MNADQAAAFLNRDPLRDPERPVGFWPRGPCADRGSGWTIRADRPCLSV